MFSVLAISAVCLVTPVNGPVVEGYSPVGQYGGHWGVDYSVGLGEAVQAPVSGTITFAGTVAGMQSVTIEPVAGFKVSVSYLSQIEVSSGRRVERGAVVGRAGLEKGESGVHLSVRINDEYVDPKSQMGCRSTDITRALRLVEPPFYPRRRAHRNPRRDVRPDPHRASSRR